MELDKLAWTCPKCGRRKSLCEMICQVCIEKIEAKKEAEDSVSS